MPACTPPRVASRDVARAAFRRWRLGSAWVLLLLVAAAAAATSAYADGSGDTSPVCADSECYTRSQFAATYTTFSALGGSVNGLNAYWGYDGSKDFCAYTGVTCRQNGVTVTASNLQLTGALPEVTDLGAFNSMVTSLDLRNIPSIIGTLPPSWSRYTALRRFTMSGTSLGGSLPSEWSTMPQLQTVDLHSTYLGGALPDSWGSMASLETLLLSGTNVSGTIPESWGALRSLQTLDLRGTSVTGCLPKAWVCDLGWTEADVGLTSASSSNCTGVAQRCQNGAPSSGTLPAWVIPVVVVLGVLLVVGTIVVVVCCCCWRRRSHARELALTDSVVSYSRPATDASLPSEMSALRLSGADGSWVPSCSSRAFSDASGVSEDAATWSPEAAETMHGERNAVRGAEAGTGTCGSGARGPCTYEGRSSPFPYREGGTGRDARRPQAATSTAQPVPLCAYETVAAVPAVNPLQGRAASDRAAGEARPPSADVGGAGITRCTTEMRRQGDRAALADSRSSRAKSSELSSGQLQSLANLQNKETAHWSYGEFVDDSTYTQLGGDEISSSSDDLP